MKKIKIIFLLTILISSYIQTTNAYSAKIREIKIDVSNSYENVIYSIINTGKINIKYLLSDKVLFKLSGENFNGNNYIDTFSFFINDKEYKNTTYNKNNTLKTIYLNIKEFKNKIIDADTKKIKFKFCPIDEKTGYETCSQIKEIQIIRNKYTDDLYSSLTYWIKDMNLLSAWKSINETPLPTREGLGVGKKVIIAVIDSGVSSQHEDLKGQMWYNRGEINGNGIDDDKNGFVDDYYGWNFIDQNNIIAPKGDHGTAVAGIIAAVKDNNKGISGIVQNVEIMPIIACSDNGCDNIDKSIVYAVNAGANIINLSLGGEWFGYTDKYSKAIEYANSKGVIIVIASGNGDKFLTGEGVNTSTNKISPVCNEKNKQDIIGVGALSLYSDKTKNGLRTNWSNYGECIDFYAYGEEIISLKKDGNYGLYNGSSFSAPIISGVIGLGFNKYGSLDNSLVYEALEKSRNKWHGIDAKKYLEELGRIKDRKIEKYVETGFITSELKKKVDEVVLKIIKKMEEKYKTEERIKSEYQKLIDLLGQIKPKLDPSKHDLVDYLKSEFEKELDSYNYSVGSELFDSLLR